MLLTVFQICCNHAKAKPPHRCSFCTFPLVLLFSLSPGASVASFPSWQMRTCCCALTFGQGFLKIQLPTNLLSNQVSPEAVPPAKFSLPQTPGMALSEPATCPHPCCLLLTGHGQPGMQERSQLLLEPPEGGLWYNITSTAQA